MTRSHTSPPKPSPLLSLICLAIVRRLHPEWTAVTLGQAISAERSISAERLSRLCTRSIARFEAIVAALTRIGRPRRDAAAGAVACDCVLLSALLDVATSILDRVRLRRAAVRRLIAGAWLRLQTDHPALTQKRFCEALSLSPRTLRSWLARPVDDPTPPVTAPPPTPPKRVRPPRRPRFGFDVTVPDTQIAADTTDLSAFGVSLKLVAAQDIGGRDSDLLDAVIVDDHECSEHVVAAITAAVNGQAGIQAITDQGTPYMAETTREALDALEAEHAPQREGDPLGKATIERAFGTVKQIAQPLLALTDRLAQALPALARVDLAKAITTLVLTALLRAYQAGARAARRADEARAGIDAETLARVAADSRERARADDRSARLLLTRVHRAYNLDRSLQTFIRTLRGFPIEVLGRAERALAVQAHRDDIRDRAAYFAGIVRRCHDDFLRQRQRRRRDQATIDKLRQNRQRHLAQLATWDQDPARWLHDALDAVAVQWQPDTKTLLCHGAGIGRAWMCGAVARLLQLHSAIAAADTAATVFRDFEHRWIDRIGRAGTGAVAGLLRGHLAASAKADTTAGCAARFSAAILRSTGPPPRPDPPFRLRT